MNHIRIYISDQHGNELEIQRVIDNIGNWEIVVDMPDRAAEQPRAAVETLICPLCDGKDYFDKEGARDTCPLCGGAGQIKNPSHR